MGSTLSLGHSDDHNAADGIAPISDDHLQKDVQLDRSLDFSTQHRTLH